MPAPPSAFLAVGLPDWAAVRGFRVPHSSQEWFRFRLFTGSVVVRAAPLYKERTRYIPILGQACQCLWPVRDDGV